MNEKQFYNELSRIPGGDEREYKNILKKAALVKRGRQALYTIAASVFFAVGLFSYSTIGGGSSNSVQLASDDVSCDEALEAVSQYFDGSAIDEDLEIYAYSYSE